MAKRKLHVVPKGKQWAVKREGASKASGVYDTKAEALDAAQKMAWRDNEAVTVHGKKGQIKKGKRYGKNPDDDNCFLTTACVRHHNLPDNCYQLTALRQFRDGYLLSTNEGNDLIKQYYSEAPKLVTLLNQHPDKDCLFENIFQQINIACDFIKENKNEEAKITYVKLVSQLFTLFPTN